ncbi:hypothetical protein CAPI_01810 [Corynebacterium capitovis DSM 44611]|uniref:FAD/NAD(P)-binding protein n=1 Tax=Corynebacterium capitovis TaxID=131081 RepID=UPI00037CDAF1|nr:FAD/NAD(P)-binding protein [Corynebacterium capitovis]WKD56936.1 hypothetical protein CAPI_01810 [Corynebacterium capitovis DSM 44611]
MPADSTIAIVGMGPRGISVIERLAAYLRELGPRQIALHLIDDAQIGAGRVWDTSQTSTLCMNTLAGAVTLFTEPGATVGAPVLEGPTMYEWIQLIRGEREGISKPKASLFDAYPVAAPTAYSAEIDATLPESNPSRTLYGEYLRWVYRVALAQLPDTVTVVEHATRATGVRSQGDADVISLADGTTVTADATVLATGWVLPAGRRVGGPAWMAPDNPVEQDVDTLPAGGDVLVRGLGMGFFDLMALVTIDRGGRFVSEPTSRSGLRYEASGREPRLLVTSGRGYPYLPKSEYHSLPPRPAMPRLRSVAREAVESGSARFGEVFWPAIVRDSYAEYYTTLARVRPESLNASLEDILKAIDSADLCGDFSAVPAALTAHLSGMSSQPFDLNEWINPLAGTESLSIDELTGLIGTKMERDIAEAVAARNSPVKAGLWVISVARRPASYAAENGRCPSSDRALPAFMNFGQMVGSGPPLFRTQELLALVDAGLVTFLGPLPALARSEEGYTITSGSRSASAPTLADAFLPAPDIRRPADPLFRSIIEAGRVRPFAPDGAPTPAPETDPSTRRTVHPDGSLDTRLHIIGIPTGGQWSDTTISPMPGTDPSFLQETDKTAASLLNRG